MPKLYNHTPWPDDLLGRVLARTAKLAGARHADVPVRVTSGRRRGRAHGMTFSAIWVYRWYLMCQAAKGGGRRIGCDGGYVTLTLCRPRSLGEGWDVDAVARSIYDLMVHEWFHIYEAQDGKWGRRFDHQGRRGRRMNWSDRPQEIRAMDAEADARDRHTGVDVGLIGEIADLLRSCEPPT